MNRPELVSRVVTAAVLLVLAVGAGVWLSKTPVTAQPPAAQPPAVPLPKLTEAVAPIPLKAPPPKRGSVIEVTVEAVVAPPPAAPPPVPAAQPDEESNEDTSPCNSPCYQPCRRGLFRRW